MEYLHSENEKNKKFKYVPRQKITRMCGIMIDDFYNNYKNIILH